MQENKMGTMPVGKLLLNMSLPMVAAMLVQALYNVVDTYFVAKLGINAVTAVSASFAIQNLMIGVATGTGVGVNALLSKSLGERKFDRANKIAANGVVLAGVGFAIFLIFGLFFTKSYFSIMSNIPEVQEMGFDYLSIVTIFSFGIFGEIIFERLMQATGKTLYTMFTQGLGALLNIVLDPIFIFGWGPIAPMGVKGAAVATVVGQIAAFVLGIILNQIFNKEIRLKSRLFRPDFRLCSKIYGIGIPSIIMVAIGSIMNFLMNQILKGIDPTEVAIAVFGIYFKLQSFVFMPVFGMNNGLIPVMAFNYGAQNRLRMMKAFKLAIAAAFCIMTTGLIIMQIIPEPLLMMFSSGDDFDSSTLLAFGVPALRIISICFPSAAIGIIIGSVFQALGKAVFSMIISICRQLVLLIPAAALLALSGKVELVWWSFPIAEIGALIMSAFMFLHIYKTIIKDIPEGAKA